ncbi:MAG TPA: hypothetical protein DC054_11725, partial [Blastocatellia bacterium]|nr:hypothetical protein [Blastocatellia bacterium]
GVSRKRARRGDQNFVVLSARHAKFVVEAGIVDSDGVRRSAPCFIRDRNSSRASPRVAVPSRAVPPPEVCAAANPSTVSTPVDSVAKSWVARLVGAKSAARALLKSLTRRHVSSFRLELSFI